jgi:hypothetical protein
MNLQVAEIGTFTILRPLSVFCTIGNNTGCSSIGVYFPFNTRPQA